MGVRTEGRSVSDVETATVDSQSNDDLVARYVENCKFYQMQPDATVLIALKFRTSSISFSNATNRESCLLPLKDILTAAHIKKISLSVCRAAKLPPKAGDANMLVLRDVLHRTESLESLHLDCNGITCEGLAELCWALTRNETLQELSLQRNPVKKEGGIILAEAIRQRKQNFPASALQLDTRYCDLEYKGAKEILRAYEGKGNQIQAQDGNVKLYGNYKSVEICNSITHGVGFIAAVIGAIYLLIKASPLHTAMINACIGYTFGCIAMFGSSTLYHSFFMLERTTQIFQILDHCSIFMMIAGSYTGLCINGPHNLVMFQWTAAGLGVGMHFLSSYKGFGKKLWYQVFELLLYIAMGNAMLLVKDFWTGFSTDVLFWIVSGGVFYMIGVPFFIIGDWRPVYHTSWHVFVVFAAICHYIAVLSIVEEQLELHGIATPIDKFRDMIDSGFLRNQSRQP